MDLHVNLVGRGRLAEQIYRQIRARIRDRRILPGSRLPSTRELAARLSVARNTVAAAYDRLTADGLIEGRPGLGMFICETAAVDTHPAGTPAVVGRPRPQPVWDQIAEPTDMSATDALFDLRPGLPSLQHFPYHSWRALVSRQLRLSAPRSDLYSEPAGSAVLRAAIARHIGVSRGVSAEASDIVVTNGFQQSIDLISRVLLAPGDRVAVEDPGYPPPAMLLRSLRTRVTGVPLDDQGLVVSAIPAGTRLVYVTPAHQFPTGMSMSPGRRRELLEWAERSDAVIVEDDYDSEFRYAGRPLEPLRGMGPSWRVLYVGSFSKTMLPSLRLGFVVAPPSLLPAMRKAKLVADWQTAGPMQDALAEFIDDGRYAKHLRRMRRIYQDRHQLIAAALDSDFAHVLERVPSMAGLHVAATLRPGLPIDDRELVRRARRRGVELGLPLSHFAITGPSRPGLVFGYGAIATERIAEAFDRLRECFDGPE
ncbi:MocR-like pyridoxine biosynthesis transcription factor PdxR [Nakamurella lactea]|uniref:MocR-like pyridoxine biosynthesis transcription factor PdxR n=1 Tax=Nakamurella lactea TaxID=459515 RepID=UPI0004173F9E|nr:PLP-dependent aminotransferase family protein [Nakamurella lactea]